MQHRKIVQPEFLNDQGFLFGGNLLKWVDESAYVTASLEFPGNRFVTIALDEVVFKHPILLGEILCFDIQLVRKGKTSVTYKIDVIGEKLTVHKEPLFVTEITFVNVDDASQPIAIN
jgi:acyl-CoA hydrolase